MKWNGGGNSANFNMKKFLRKIKLYTLLYWNTFIFRFKKKENHDVYIYEEQNELERNTNKKN